MPCTIDATVGGVSANAYADIAFADAYHEAHLYNTTWTAATADEKCRALQMATRMLDAQVAWFGWIATTTQALLWPRSGVIGRTGYAWQPTVLPTELKQAAAELARVLLAGGRTPDVPASSDGISRLVAGPVEIEFDGTRTDPREISDAVFYLIQHLGVLRTRGAGSIALTRV